MSRPACYFLVLTMVILTAPCRAAQTNEADLDGSCKAAVLMEPDSGEVLFEKEAHIPLPPASMVKMMVTYVTMKRLQEGSVKLSDVITTSAAASKIGGSQVYLKQGEQFTLGQLLEAVMIQSANDAAMAIAEHVGGSAAGFVDMMNAEALELGMKDTTYYFPHGLPPSKGQQPDLMSAYDLALLAKAIVTQYPQVLEYTGKDTGAFRDGAFIMNNHNKLVRTYPGCDGLKTGYYSEAGFGVTATAKRNGIRIIAAVMGCKESKKRDQEAARLLSLGFSRYRVIKLIDKGAPAQQEASVAGGVMGAIRPVTAAELKGAVKGGLEKAVARKDSLCTGLQAPVAAGTRCGSAVFSAGGNELGRVDLIIPQDIARAGFLKRMLQKVTQ